MDYTDERSSDSHNAVQGAWKKRTARLELRHAKLGEAWTKADGKLLEQTGFTELIEQQALNAHSRRPRS